MPQPMSTPTAAGDTAPFIATTEPTVAPLPRCTSGMAATWWKHHGNEAMFFSWSSACDSTSAIGVHSLMGTLRLLISARATLHKIRLHVHRVCPPQAEDARPISVEAGARRINHLALARRLLIEMAMASANVG